MEIITIEIGIVLLIPVSPASPSFILFALAPKELALKPLALVVLNAALTLLYVLASFFAF